MAEPLHEAAARAVHEARGYMVRDMPPWDEAPPMQRETAMFIAGAVMEVLRKRDGDRS
jgi:hypothetical protein